MEKEHSKNKRNCYLLRVNQASMWPLTLFALHAGIFLNTAAPQIFKTKYRMKLLSKYKQLQDKTLNRYQNMLEQPKVIKRCIESRKYILLWSVSFIWLINLDQFVTWVTPSQNGHHIEEYPSCQDCQGQQLHKDTNKRWPVVVLSVSYHHLVRFNRPRRHTVKKTTIFHLLSPYPINLN